MVIYILVNNDMIKKCPKCDKNKNREEFYINKGTKDGRRSWCIDCCNERSRDWYNKNKESVRIRHDKWVIDNDEYIKNYRSEYYSRGYVKYKFYKRNASLRNIVFNLNFDEFVDLINKPCFYCGEKPRNSNGIDRVNNQKDYVVSNCVPCCSLCNRMKGKYAQDVFLSQIKKINNKLYFGGV